MLWHHYGSCVERTVKPTATAVAATPTAEPSLGVFYSAQVELPFGELVNHLGWVASDAEGNVYVLDDLNFRVLKLPVR